MLHLHITLNTQDYLGYDEEHDLTIGIDKYGELSGDGNIDYALENCNYYEIDNVYISGDFYNEFIKTVVENNYDIDTSDDNKINNMIHNYISSENCEYDDIYTVIYEITEFGFSDFLENAIKYELDLI